MTTQNTHTLLPEEVARLMILPLVVVPLLIFMILRVLGASWRTLTAHFADPYSIQRTGWAYAPPLMIGWTQFSCWTIEFVHLDEHLCLRMGSLTRLTATSGLALPHASMELGKIVTLPLTGNKLRVVRIHCTADHGPVITCRLPLTMFAAGAKYRNVPDGQHQD